MLDYMDFFFFKQKTAYEMRISDWSSDVCSSDLPSFAAIANPADVTAESIRDQSMYQECVQSFAADAQFASVIVLMPSAHGAAAVSRAEAQIGRASCRERVCQYV